MQAKDATSPPDQPQVPIALAGGLVLLSGCCALVYQVCWLRQLRLVFGASTAANAAVLAIFMGGLGLGAWVLGPRADAHPRPLRLYGKLELGVAVLAALSPWLIDGIRSAYVSLGGTPELGDGPGTALRLGLSLLVLGLPTFFMGGTLPAVVRAVERVEDPNRRHLGLLYGLNTLGAVGGVLLATFLAIEWWGIRQTLWTAVAVNLMVAGTAIWLASRRPPHPEKAKHTATAVPTEAPPTLVLTAAAGTGFAFLLMELIWYRMLAPLLGGSSYSFGMILAVALFGIGTGGWLYGTWAARRAPTVVAFGFTAALQGVLLALPLAMGDGFALFAASLQPLGQAGFGALTGIWFLIAAACIWPPAVVAGFQFPLLVGLLGRGEQDVGTHVGKAYALNTVGAIAGSLAGGFGLVPLLGAVGAWRGVVLLMAALGVAAAWVGRGHGRRPRLLVVLIAAIALAMASSPGPTAVWRHGAIGVGRSGLVELTGVALEDRLQEIRRSTLWEAEGVESSIALQSLNGHAFVIGGKIDGHVLGDAPTNLWLGLLPTLLHPNAEEVLVIGLGTGQTAGWAAAVDTVNHVDVVELEPAIAVVAAVCASSNRDVMAAPQVEIHYGDAREWLMVTPKTYDVIVSEPSNPFRAGIASLFSLEFYKAARNRLQPDGLFLQWLQTYELNQETLATALATLHAAFSHVEIWEGASNGDLLLVASQVPVQHDLTTEAARVGQAPWRAGLDHGWHVAGLAGLYAGYVGGTPLVEALSDGAPLNVDDHPVIEFGFARTVGQDTDVYVEQLRAEAAALGLDAAPVPIDTWARLEARHTKAVAGRKAPNVPAGIPTDIAARMGARVAWTEGDLPAAGAAWDTQNGGPQSPVDHLILGEIRAAAGDMRALDHARQLKARHPTEALLVHAALAEASGDPQAATTHMIAALSSAHGDPWVHPKALSRGLKRAVALGYRGGAPVAAPLLEQLVTPFAGGNLDEARRGTALRLGQVPGMAPLCAQALSTIEPHPHWHRDVLQARVDCYTQLGHPLLPTAERDLARLRD